jgi:hypothetical protein
LERLRRCRRSFGEDGEANQNNDSSREGLRVLTIYIPQTRMIIVPRWSEI